MSSSNDGQIADTPHRSSQVSPDKTFGGRYVSFRYKSTYAEHKLAAKDMDLELVTFKAGTDYDKDLAVAVSKLPGGNLNQNSAYNLRQSDPADYTARQVTVTGESAIVMVKQDGHEQTVFVPHGDKVAVLSFSTVGTVDDLTAEVNAVLNSFRWKG